MHHPNLIFQPELRRVVRRLVVARFALFLLSALLMAAAAWAWHISHPIWMLAALAGAGVIYIPAIFTSLLLDMVRGRPLQ